MIRAHRKPRRGDEGRVTAFVVTLITAILALGGLALDGGLALAARVRANSAAESAARAGAQAIDLALYRSTGRVHLVPAEASINARRYLARVGATGTVSVSGNTVSVTVTTSGRTQLLSLVGVSTLTVTAEASAHAQRGVVDIES